MSDLSEWSVGEPIMAYFAAAMFCVFWGLFSLLLFAWKGKDQGILFKVVATPPVLVLMASTFYATVNLLSQFLGFYVWPLPLF